MTRDLALEAQRLTLEAKRHRYFVSPRGQRERRARELRDARTDLMRAELGVRGKGRRAR